MHKQLIIAGIEQSAPLQRCTKKLEGSQFASSSQMRIPFSTGGTSDVAGRTRQQIREPMTEMVAIYKRFTFVSSSFRCRVTILFADAATA